MRVLIVEEEPAVGSVLRDFILEFGHDADVVRSADAAVGWLRQDRPDLILLDFRLPGMTGLEFLGLREVRASHIPVVVVRGIDDAAQVQPCLGLGVREAVATPIAFDHLRRILERLARRPGCGPKVERRRAPRVPVEVPVKGRDAHGAEWDSVSVDLSPHGIKVSAAGPAEPDTTVALSFPSPDGAERFEMASRLARADHNGYVFHFSHPTGSHLERLTHLVRQQAASS